MTEPRLSEYLAHILDAIARITNYVDGLDRDGFRADGRTQDAVIRNFGIIGEAAQRIRTRHPEFASQHPEIQLRAAARMRNFVLHVYFSVDLDVVWDTIHDDLPALDSSIRAVTAEGGE